MTSDFAAFMKFRADAAASIANGETEHLDNSVTHADPATFFSPLGGAVTGASEVKSRYESDARMFDSAANRASKFFTWTPSAISPTGPDSSEASSSFGESPTRCPRTSASPRFFAASTASGK